MFQQQIMVQRLMITVIVLNMNYRLNNRKFHQQTSYQNTKIIE